MPVRCINCHNCREAFNPLTDEFMEYCCTEHFRGIGQLSDVEESFCTDYKNKFASARIRCIL